MKQKKLFFLFYCFFFYLLCCFAQNINIIDLTQQLNADLYWDTISGTGILEKKGHIVQFQTNETLVVADYVLMKITDAPVRIDGNVFVTENFAECVRSFLDSGNGESLFTIGAVLIDPGHGGKDSGAVGKHTVDGKKFEIYEKDVVLKVSEELYKKLKKTYPDKKILMTRSDDTFLSLEERVEMANAVPLDSHEAILYVSIHANSAFDKKASGFEVWYLSPGYRRTIIAEDAAEKEILPILNTMLEEEFTTESTLIAKFILENLDAAVGDLSPNRGIKEEEWFVVRNANMPSVLVEVGFVSNEKEALLLADESYLRKVTAGIYNGLAAFIMHFERSRGFTGE